MSRVDRELSQVSERIRQWREEAGLTLQDLARRSGVATSTIQKVETARMIPSLAVILKIARGLGRHPAELVREAGDDVEVVHTRPAERHPVGVRNRMLLERLSGDLFEPALEMWRVTLHPGCSSGDPIRYDGEELVVCERGVLTLRIGEQEFRLRAGDTLHFKARVPHAWRNDGDTLARFTVTGTLPRRLRAALQSRAAASPR